MQLESVAPEGLIAESIKPEDLSSLICQLDCIVVGRVFTRRLTGQPLADDYKESCKGEQEHPG